MPSIPHQSIQPKLWIIAAILFLLCLLTYFNSLNNDFMIDDSVLLLQDNMLHNIKFLPYQFLPEKLSFLTGADHKPEVYYRPLAHIVPMLGYLFFKENPLGYHILNLALLALCCFSIYILITKVSTHWEWGLLTAGFYATHPINGIMVNYITASVFGVQVLAMTWASIVFYKMLEKPDKREGYHFIVVLLFVAACLCHESAMALPFYLAATAYFLKKFTIRQTLKITALYWFFLAAYFYMRLHIASLKQNILDKFIFYQMGFWEYTASLTKIIVWYITRLFSLNDIVLIWATPVVRHNLILWNMGFILLICAILLCFRFRNRLPVITWGGIWFALGFLPVTLGCLFHPSIGVMIEPHWLIFPVIGFFTLLAGSIFSLKKLPHSHIPWSIGIILVTIFIAASWPMNKLWGNEKKYCHYWWDNVPSIKSIMFYLASAHLRDGEIKEARQYFLTSLENGTDDWQTYTNLGLIDFKENRIEDAIVSYKKAIIFLPSSAIIYNNLGIALKAKGMDSQAEQAFLQAIHLNYFLLEPRLNLAGIYIKGGQFQKAKKLGLENFGINPENGPNLQLLIAIYFQENNPVDALPLAKRLLNHSRNAQLLTETGSLLAIHRYNDLAKQFYLKALRLNPRYPEVYLELGKLLGNYNQFETAIQLWDEGARLSPGNPKFRELIAQAKLLQTK